MLRRANEARGAALRDARRGSWGDDLWLMNEALAGGRRIRVGCFFFSWGPRSWEMILWEGMEILWRSVDRYWLESVRRCSIAHGLLVNRDCL